jgi:hypothetical protein
MATICIGMTCLLVQPNDWLAQPVQTVQLLQGSKPKRFFQQKPLVVHGFECQQLLLCCAKELRELVGLVARCAQSTAQVIPLGLPVALIRQAQSLCYCKVALKDLVFLVVSDTRIC